MINKSNTEVFIYLDSEGIESLYAQTANRLEIEFTQSKEKGKGGRVVGNISVGRLLGTLLGLGGIEAGTEVSLSGRTIEEAKYRLTTEQKMFALLDYFRTTNRELYFEDLLKAAVRSSNIQKSVFILTEQEFNAPQFYDGGKGVLDVNASGAIIFEIGFQRSSLYDHSDSYFKKSKSNSAKTRGYSFVMSASLTKFTRIYDQMRLFNHETFLFRSHSGRNIPLGVFGHLSTIGEYFFQIKPFAIWR
jgi:hypothetical protein